jgi:sigma-B regulation protein RsbU (phosphoserine phosphatase)
MVGSFDGIPFEEAKVSLAPGDRIVLYTDGLSEAMDAQREMYGDDRIADFAATLPVDQSARESIDAIMAGIATFLDGEEPQDDMTLMVLRVLGAPADAARPVAALPGAR